MSDNNTPVILNGLGLWGSSFRVKRCTHCLTENDHDDIKEELCFFFVADCQGDSISICRKHLQMVIDEMDRVKA